MVYARVSKTRGCNDLESSSLSPGTMTKQYELNLPTVVELVDSTKNDFAKLCELAIGLAGDESRLKTWRQLSLDKRHGGLSPERAKQLEIAEKILSGKIKEGRNGWYELPEVPKSNQE